MKPLAPLAAMLALAGMLLGSTPASAALTPAGTQIINQAQVQFNPPLPGDPSVAYSNTVYSVVQPVCALSITPDGTVNQPGRSVQVLPGEQAVFPYTLVNAGNATGAFPVLGRVETGSNIAPAVKVVLDSNGNGSLDDGEAEVSSVNLPQDGSAKLLLVVQTNAAQGDAFVNLVSSCAGGSNADTNNVSLVQVGPPPALSVVKSFQPALLRPGTQTTVTVTATNNGQGASREVLLTDLLEAQAAQGLTFVAGSASTNVGTLEYTTDGTVWTDTEAAPVRGVRVRVPSLPAGGVINLTFRMQATATAEGKVIQNVATATTGAQTSTGSASADVRYQPNGAIGPVGNPEAPESTQADQQVKAFAAIGQTVCFDHTAKNTGDVQDNFSVTVTYPQGAATATLYGANGQPLAQPFTLTPGQETLVRVCYDATQAGSLEALITLTGERGSRNTTRDQVTRVETGLPELRKSYAATALNEYGQLMTLAAGSTVTPGTTITYTLIVRNPYDRALTNVVISDPLPAHVDFVSASADGAVSGAVGSQTVSWNLGTLAAQESRALKVVTTVAERAVDGEALTNVFNLVSTEFPSPLPSNEVQTPVWKAKLLIEKQVNRPQASYGEVLTYTLKITNQSATTAIVDATITDTPDAGLEYVPGTSTLEGKPLADPTIENGVLRWNVAMLPAGGTVTVTYQIRVTPAANGELVNIVEVTGTGAGGVARAIASNTATASTQLNVLQFAPNSDVIGVVFIDRNRNGLYDAQIDTPVARARVLLAGGRQVLTDQAGRYSFPNVPNGTHALRLDPNTTPYPPLKVTADSGLSGTQVVQVRGLTSVNFPLAPLGGDISAMRRTTLIIGDVRVEKSVYAVQGGYIVALRITTPSALEGVNLTDPLPGSATLKEGRNTFSGSLPAGETYFTYRFDWVGAPWAATTDPVMSWRY